MELRVVKLEVSFDDSCVLAIFVDNRGSVEVDLVVDDEQRVVRVNNVVVDGYAIEVLLEQVLEEQVLLLESGLLFFDGQFVELDLVVTLVEVVETFELVDVVLVNAIDLDLVLL